MKYSLTSPSRLLALFSLAAFSVPLASAQEWVVVDTFAGGAPQDSWTFSSGFANEVRSSDAGNYLFVTSATGNTERASVVLPQTVSSGKVTIAFDFFAPGGRSLNQVGFGAGSAAMVARGAWAGVGLQNRFQMVDRTVGATEFLDKIPQFLAKAGVALGDVEWTIDILEPTLQGVWYNIWVVYDLDDMEVSLFARRANADTEDAVHRGTWDLAGATVAEDFAEISRFALGAGGSGNTDAPALGGQFANIYMAVGENLNLTPTAIVLDPPSWQAVDTFVGAMPNATWEGDLEKFNLDFSEGYLHMLPTAQTDSPRGESIYTALPEEVEFGVFTVTFDFLINAPSTSRSDVSFAAVGTAQLESTDNWVRRGGDTRLGTFGAAPQAFRAFSPPTTIAIPGAQVAEQWYHAWVVYNLAQRRIDFHYAPFGAAAPSGEPAASWAFDAQVDYSNFTHFIVGLDRPTSTGLRLGNLYFVADELLTLSPTAGTFTPDLEWSAGNFFSSPLFGSIYYFGENWAQWYPLVGVYADFGSVWVGELEPLDTEGWFYHAQGESWLYGISASTHFYAYVQTLGQWIYVSMAAEEPLYYIFADEESGWFTWGEGPLFPSVD
ncbi:MAG: hypothetical protein JJT96_03510 [Opitutales bacterium]|nr:hypothetical protein [Opitutales bacterium]